MLRKSLILKTTLISLLLVVSIYIFTYHSEKIQPSYDSLKNGINWNGASSDSTESTAKADVKDDDDSLPIEVPHATNPKGTSSVKDINDYEGKDATKSEIITIEQGEDGDLNIYENNNDDKLKDVYSDIYSGNSADDETFSNNPYTPHSKGNEPFSASTDSSNEYFHKIEMIDISSEMDPSLHSDWNDDKKAIMEFLQRQSKHDGNLPKRTSLFSRIFKLISDCKPETNRLDDYPNGKCGVQFVHNDETPYYTKEKLLEYLKIEEASQKELTKQHEKLIKNLPDELPDSIYEKGSKGIVYVGGNKFSWLTLLSIINLRENNCQLPVEVLIPKYEEFELNICENVLPNYNAKCIYLPTIVGEDVYEEYQFKGYQYKSLALSLSSFENVLLLDADNTALIDPEVVFESEPFTSNGLLLWPDFWKRTTHPSFYDIIGVKVDENKRRDMGYHEYGQFIKKVQPDDLVLFHQLENTLPDPSTESGQLFISKKTHFRTLVLSLYYNTYGPDYYYPLLSQGAAGEGDKETFMAAAHALGEKYHTIKRHVIPLGRFRNGDFHGSAMGQANPIQDYELEEKYKDTTEEVHDRPDFLFVHANFPKLDPWSLKNDDVIYDKEKDERNRLFGEGFIDDAKYDFELRMWNIMKKLLCDEELEFYNFKNQDLQTRQVCEEVLQHLEYLQSTTKDV